MGRADPWYASVVGNQGWSADPWYASVVGDQGWRVQTHSSICYRRPEVGSADPWYASVLGGLSYSHKKSETFALVNHV